MEDEYFTGGWVKIYSKILKHPVYQDSFLFHLFIYCLLTANWKETQVVMNGQVITLQRGQLITGRKKLVKDLTGLQRENSKQFLKMESLYRRRLDMLVELHCITIKSTNKYSVITIQNWDKYQSNDHQTTIKQPSNDHIQEYKEYKDNNNTNVLLSDPSDTDAVDNQISVKVSTPNRKTSYVQEVVTHYQTVTGARIANWARAGRDIKAMKDAGYSVEDMKWAIDKLWENDWWKAKGITLLDVCNQIPALMTRTVMYDKKGARK